MVTQKSTAPVRPDSPVQAMLQPGPELPDLIDGTPARIRAFIDSMRMLRGMEYPAHHDRGWALLERIAKSADRNTSEYSVPKIRLNAEDCACVLRLMTQIEPKKRATWWWDDKGGASHICGRGPYLVRPGSVSAETREGAVMSALKISTAGLIGDPAPTNSALFLSAEQTHRSYRLHAVRRADPLASE